ncbi:MAG: hypothetical protein A2252_08105 [Elusimicrobia bacterium RIFOXYA2_FULL_39_19]|nr:MAG: hypothetical protein A2252_08105 [Elusimicrobia bacterium RIFOXYA2_FULL_39_19]
MESIIEKAREKLGNKVKNYFKKNEKRHYLEINPHDIIECTKIMFNGLESRFITATGVHLRTGFEIMYHFSYDKTGEVITLRVYLNEKDKPEIDSITPLIRGAEWIEREIWEMLGINFKNHPNMKRLLLAEDWPEGKYPLRQTEK